MSNMCNGSYVRCLICTMAPMYDVSYVHHISAGLTTHVDDEYAWCGVEDPKIVVTTSHTPSSRLKQFAKVELEQGDS